MKFLIIGNKNAVTYKDFFPFIRDGAVWFGTRRWGRQMVFLRPDGTRSSVPVVWFTNMDHGRRPGPMRLAEVYEP